MDWTVKKILDWSTEYFQAKGFESPRLESEILLAHSLGMKRLDLYLQFDRPLEAGELADYKALIKRRTGNEPSAYIVGKKEFWSRDFEVTKDVLIPRPDTETLIQTVLDEIKEKDREMKAFEMGLGSGVIAITLALELKNLTVDAVEVSASAAEIARKNADKHGVIERIKITEADFLTTDEGNYDFIVSNPPYIRKKEITELESTVKDYEPTGALDGGESGLKYYKPLAEFAKRHLNAGGFIAIEIGEDQGKDVENIFKETGFKNVEIRKDLSCHDRVLVAKQNG